MECFIQRAFLAGLLENVSKHLASESTRRTASPPKLLPVANALLWINQSDAVPSIPVAAINENGIENPVVPVAANPHLEAKQPQCYKCGQKGHLRRECARGRASINEVRAAERVKYCFVCGNKSYLCFYCPSRYRCSGNGL
mgnify:CR=1 FL=1